MAIPQLRSTPTFEDDSDLEHFLLSTFRLVTASKSLLNVKNGQWSSRAFLQILKASKRYSIPVRLLALRIFSILERTSDTTLEALQVKYIGTLDVTSAESIAAAQSATLTIRHDGQVVEQLNAWILPLEETERVHRIKKKITPHLNFKGTFHIDTFVFSERVINLGGTLFFREASHVTRSSSLYRETDTIRATLSDISTKLSNRLPILVSGPEACGKSSIIRYACDMLHPDSTSQIVTLQLGDQSGVDAKSLIGTYISSIKNPGTFEWAEGALTRSLRLGKWVVLEDVDKASGEVLSVIKPLVEDMGKDKPIGSLPSLDLGPRGRVYASASFALFATRTTPIQKRNSNVPGATFYSHGHWAEVAMKALQEDDILEIVRCTCPLLSTSEDGTLETLVKTWSRLQNVATSRKASSFTRDRLSSSGTLRVPSLHDLLKWCQRIETLLQRTGSSATLLARAPLANQAIHEEIVLEACDIFLGSTPVM